MSAAALANADVPFNEPLETLLVHGTAVKYVRAFLCMYAPTDARCRDSVLTRKYPARDASSPLLSMHAVVGFTALLYDHFVTVSNRVSSSMSPC